MFMLSSVRNVKLIKENTMKCWLGVVSKEHVMRGVAGNYVQVCHGKKAPLNRMKSGDLFVYYSPVVTFGGKDKLQAFTAIGIVQDETAYQVEMFPGFKPFRRDVKFEPSCVEVPIASLKSKLSITQGNWGMTFRRGHIEVPLDDFRVIAAAMKFPFNFDSLALMGTEPSSLSDSSAPSSSHSTIAPLPEKSPLLRGMLDPSIVGELTEPASRVMFAGTDEEQDTTPKKLKAPERSARRRAPTVESKSESTQSALPVSLFKKSSSVLTRSMAKRASPEQEKTQKNQVSTHDSDVPKYQRRS